VRVAPHVETRTTVDVLLAHVHAAGVSDASVDDDDLEVVAIVEFVEFGEVGLDLDSRCLQRVEFVFGVHEGADEVVHDPHIHALGDLAAQHVGHPRGELVAFPDEVLEMDVVRCRFHVRDQAVELLGPRGEDLDRLGGQRVPVTLALDHRDDLGHIGTVVTGATLVRPELLGGVDGGQHPVRLGGVLRIDTRLTPPPGPDAAREEVQRDAHYRQEQEYQKPGERGRRVAVLVDEDDDHHDDVDDDDRGDELGEHAVSVPERDSAAPGREGLCGPVLSVRVWSLPGGNRPFRLSRMRCPRSSAPRHVRSVPVRA
jgi:hypothetical protein